MDEVEKDLWVWEDGRYADERLNLPKYSPNLKNLSFEKKLFLPIFSIRYDVIEQRV